MVRTRSRLIVGLVAAIAGSVGIGWTLSSLHPAGELSAGEQRQGETAMVMSDVAAALRKDARDAAALAQLDAALPQMFDTMTGVPEGRPHAALAGMMYSLQDAMATASDRARLGRIVLLLGLNGVASDLLAEASRGGAGEVSVPLAVALLRADRFVALRELEPESFSTGQQQAAFRTLQGRAAFQLGQLNAARRSFDAALAADPTHVDAIMRWALLELWHGNKPEAAALLARARQTAPMAPATLRLDAEVAYADRDFSKSAELYALLAARPGPEPHDPIAPQLGHIRALIYQGDVAAAEAMLATYQAPGAGYYKALAAYRAGRFREASEQALLLERELAGWPPLQLLLGAAMLESDSPNLALDRLRRYAAAVRGNQAAERLLAVAERRSRGATALPARDDLDTALGFPASVTRKLVVR